MAALEFVETLRLLASNDNTSRNAAEHRFSDAREQQPVSTVAALFQVLSDQQLEEVVRKQAAVLLRQCLGKVRQDKSTWSQLGDQAHIECKAKVLQLLEGEGNPSVRKQVRDIVQSLGNQLIDIAKKERPQNIQAWPELLPALLRIVMDGSRDASLRADAIWTVKELLTSVWQVMVANHEQTLLVLRSCLADQNVAVKTNAAGMLCELIDNVDSKKDRDVFAVLVADLCAALEAIAENSDNTYIDTLLQAMEPGGNTVEFYKDALGSELLPRLARIAGSHVQNDTRRLALEVIISLGEEKPKTLAKLPAYIEQTLDISVKFLLELEDDLAEWANQDDDEADDEEQYKFGKEVVDRLCRQMDKVERFPFVFDKLKPVMTTFLQSSDWKQVIAGVTIAAQTVEYVDEEETILQMAGAVLGVLQSSNPRIRHVAWTAVAQLAQDHSDMVTGEHLAGQLLPLFFAGIDDSYTRVSFRSMEAFFIYGQEVEREVLEPFVPGMMEKLGLKLQTGDRTQQCKAITYVAVLAGQMKDDFANYYSSLMPMLKQIIQAIHRDPDQRSLLGKAFECVSLLARAVGSDGFRADAEGIMQAMVQAASLPNLPSNDPVKEYMMQAAQRICWTMHADFFPFLPPILPGILEKLTLAPKEFNEQSRNEVDDDEEVNLTIVQGEDGKVKVMIMSTSEIEDLQNALECVHTFIEELGKLYAPFVAQTAQALLPVFEFDMQERIRDLAFETWAELCNAAREGQQTDIVAQLVHEFLNRILPKLAQSDDLEAMATRADGVAACIRNAGPDILTAQQLTEIAQIALTLIGNSFKRQEEEAQKGKDDDADEDEDDDSEEVALRHGCCQVINSLMVHNKDTFTVQALPLCMPLVQQLIQPTIPALNRRLAMHLACGMLEHLGTHVTPHWPQFLPQMLQDILNPVTEARQAACSAAGMAAKNPAFAPFAVEASNKLMQVVSESRSRAKKKSEKPAQACADAALTAIASILEHHQPTVAALQTQMWSVWLQGLPCQEDETEGKQNHETLLKLTLKEHRDVVGDGGANMPHVLAVLVDVCNSDMSSEETSKGIGKLVVKLGGAYLEQLAQKLSQKQQKKLVRIVKEANAEAAV